MPLKHMLAFSIYLSQLTTNFYSLGVGTVLVLDMGIGTGYDIFRKTNIRVWA
jgi:hypothetical protein